MTDNRSELYFAGQTNSVAIALVNTFPEWEAIFERVTVRPGQTLVHGGTRPALLHFPIDCICVDLVSPTGVSPTVAEASKLNLAKDDTIQVAMHGNQDVVSIQALLSNSLSSRQTVVDYGGQALRCTVQAARRLFETNASSRELLLAYAALFLEELAQQAAAEARLGVPERVAAYLLRTAQLLEEAVIPVTHVQISKRLGCRRPSVTEALQAMEKDGTLMQVDKGRIQLLKVGELAMRVEAAWPVWEHGRQAFANKLVGHA